MIILRVNGRLPAGFSAVFAKKILGLAYATAGRKGDAAVSVSIVGDAAMRRLNAAYRGKDKTTDVLSFAYGESAVFPREKALTKELGDLVLSLPQIKRQAKHNDRSLKEECSLMLVHGLLHLLGYDHETLAQEKVMFRLQHAILNKAGIF